MTRGNLRYRDYRCVGWASAFIAEENDERVLKVRLKRGMDGSGRTL